MPKPKGGKRIRRGKKHNEETTKRQLEFKDEEQDYAIVDKVLGNCRLSVLLSTQETRLGIIPGKFKKRVWINKGDVVLVSLRTFEDDKVDIIHKYNADEVRTLIQYEEIPSTWSGDGDGDGDGDGGDENRVAFGDDSDESYKSTSIKKKPHESDSESESESEDLDISKKSMEQMLQDL